MIYINIEDCIVYSFILRSFFDEVKKDLGDPNIKHRKKLEKLLSYDYTITKLVDHVVTTCNLNLEQEKKMVRDKSYAIAYNSLGSYAHNVIDKINYTFSKKRPDNLNFIEIHYLTKMRMVSICPYGSKDDIMSNYFTMDKNVQPKLIYERREPLTQ